MINGEAAAAHVDELIDTLRACLPGNGRLIVTADHGMQNGHRAPGGWKAIID